MVVFPGSGSPKNIRLSKWLVKVAVLGLILLLAGLGGSSYYFSNQYFHLLDGQAELSKIKRESKIQKVQLEKFSHRIKNFETEMARLERFEKKLRVITALENSPKSMEKSLGLGGPYGLSSQSFSTSMDAGTRSILDRLNGDLGNLDNQAQMQLISFQELDEFFKNQESFLSSTPSIWPTKGWVTSKFGYRKSPFTGMKERHEGWDIAARSGTPVRATANGVVKLAGKDYGYGNLVEIDHGYNIVTRYGHNSKHAVKVGDRVKRGQVVAYVGSTGRSTGPHLHYEVLVNGIPVNPKNYILED